jgi:hypothetical protein
MAETILSQAEADALIAVEKAKADALTYPYPNLGGVAVIPLVSTDGREEFVLDIRRGRIDLAKITHQLRARQIVVLVRLDIAGPTHTNPDGASVPCPHIHVYREGYADKWAAPLPPSFTNPADLWQTLHEFMAFCHVVDPPAIERGLFP